MAVLTTYKTGNNGEMMPTNISSGLSAGWVYYERLKEDGHQNLYNTIYSRLNNIEKPNISSTSVKKLLVTANNELAKEQHFLSSVFGVPAYDWNYDNFKDKKKIQKLLDDLNRFLNIPEVYERCVHRIKIIDQNKKNKGQAGEIVKITIAEFFPQYFESLRGQYIESDWSGSIKTALIKEWNKIEILDKNTLKKFYENANKIIEDKIDKLIRATFEKMFRSSDFNKGFENLMRQTYGDDTQAYQIMIDWIDDTKNQLSGSKSFFQTVYDIYDFNNFKKTLTKLTKQSFNLSQKTLNDIEKKMSTSLKGTIVKTSTATGEVSEKLTEVLTNNAYRLFIEKLTKNGEKNNYTIKSAHIGKIEAKPDIVFVFEEEGINKIEKEIKKTYNELKKNITIGSDDSLRIKNIEAHEQLSEKLKKIKKGFIIYTNAKNYTINKNFRGFQSGSKISLETYKEIMNKLNKSDEEINTFVGAIINTIGSSKRSQSSFTKSGNEKTEYRDWVGTSAEGAIGYKLNIKNKLEDYLALDIAYFLFDDFSEIGENLEQNSVNTLHFMNLNGLYIPLSFILYLLYQSFLEVEESNNKIHKYSKATINPDPLGIRYPLGYEEDGNIIWGQWGLQAWEEQKRKAMINTKIGLKFLQSFKEVIGSWF